MLCVDVGGDIWYLLVSRVLPSMMVRMSARENETLECDSENLKDCSLSFVLGLNIEFLLVFMNMLRMPGSLAAS